MTTVYDAVKDFPASNNNAGPWTFGYSEAGDSAYRMIRFDNTAANVGGFPGVVWSKSGYNTAGTPSIWRNLAAFPRYGVAPGQLSLHPGPRPRGDFTILRFTAPAAGKYKIRGQFFAGDTGPMNARVLQNERFANPLQSFATTTDASVLDPQTLDLLAGATLDFVVGNNGNFGSGNTPISLEIEADVAGGGTTLYDSTADFQITGNASGVWRYGYSVATGPVYAFIPFDNTVDNQAAVRPGIAWSKTGYNTSGTPTAWLNKGTATRYGVPPGAMSLHPGPRPNGDCAILRFVAPRTALYTVRGGFMAGDSGRMDGTIVLDGNFVAPLRSFPECVDTSTFDIGPLAMSIGQTLDFIVGNKGNYGAGNTPISVRIESGGTWGVDDLNNFVDSFGRMPPIVQSTTDVGPSTTRLVDAAGVGYTVTEQKRIAVNGVVNNSYLSDIAAMGVWPGQVIQSEGLSRSEVNAIGPFPRMPGKVEIVTELVPSPRTPVPPPPRFRDVAAPDSSSVNEARQEILSTFKPKDSAGDLKAEFLRANTVREVGLSLGLTITGSAFGVDANASLDQTYKKSVVVGVLRQTFYSVNFTPLSQSAGGFWDPARTRSSDLARYMRSGNPPLFVKSVQFGRMVCVTAEGAFSSSEMKAALKAHYDSAVSVGGTFSGRLKEVMDSMDVRIYTMGVPGHIGFEKLTDPVPELDAVYKAGREFNEQNPGRPISFTCNHIADGTSAAVQVVAEYVTPTKALGVDVVGAQSKVFDGPGGGLRETGIAVNPGDSVTIAAGGLIDSGVVFSQPNGPEGWTGHTADRAAPLPSGTAYCLVHKFSKDTDWLETKGHWDGSSRNGGKLLLNTNDNNPYNGNPALKWTVTADVRRASAGAVGIFV